MTVIVADTSVVVKWLLPDRTAEADTERALALYGDLMEERLSLVQPPHWLAEIGGVLARVSPETAAGHMEDLWLMDVRVAASLEIYQTAAQLALRLKHHLFDTLYHAVALSLPEATLVTADDAYYRKARRLGCIRRLADHR